MKLQWLCIFLFVCLMSGSCIADDFSQENTQSPLCKSKYATNLGLCEEAISPSEFVLRCLEDDQFCIPGNKGKIEEINKDTNEQSHAADDANLEVAWEGNWPALALDSDETLAVLGILLEALSSEEGLSEEEWENIVDATFWETFWGTLLGSFLGGFMSELDDEILTDLDNLLKSEIFWEAFWEAYIDAMYANEGINIALGANDLSDKAYDAGMEVAWETDWIDPKEAGREMFEAA